MEIAEKIFGSDSKRELKKVKPILKKILALADETAQLTDAELQHKTVEFKERIANKESLDSILPEAFAVVREADKRVLGMYPYEVQLIGGIVLHQGRVAEMKTGEGKTLMATLPAYLNALTGKGVHIVTVNDYLAKRDAEQMGKVYGFLGLSTGLITHEIEGEARKLAYDADITYGTNNEMGFDYLRDNMAFKKNQQVQRGHAFAIVDEVDSILIDEARTPLIISGMGNAPDGIYEKVEELVSGMKVMIIPETDSKENEDEELEFDYVVSEKSKAVTLTARGVKKVEEFFGIENLSDTENAQLAHFVNQSIRAHGALQKDVNYIVTPEQEVVIVDEYTGRLMPGRRFSDGMHQAIEAKEHVPIQKETETRASVSFQNYFRMYTKLSGMTGTAMTERDEFAEIYKLDVIEVPTNKPVIRVDEQDSVYKTEDAKLHAVIEEVKTRHENGQPVLIGTPSVKKNEEIHKLLVEAGIPHNVLNAKNHEKEAAIIAQAGKLGAVTVATNMAGRGTDIMLGGNAEYMAEEELKKKYSNEVVLEAIGFSDAVSEEVLNARKEYNKLLRNHKQVTDAEGEIVRSKGGLAVIGTERHDSRRVDNQLRGRAGRQGDPGISHFYVSLEDELMRLFGGEQMHAALDNREVPDDVAIQMKVVSKAIQNAQITIESRHYQARKDVIEYDDVMNTQRQLIYSERQKVLDGMDLHESILKMMDKAVDDAMAEFESKKVMSQERIAEAVKKVGSDLLPSGVEFRFAKSDLETMTSTELTELFKHAVHDILRSKEEQYGTETVRNIIEPFMLLTTVDEYWVEELGIMSDLQQNVQLRAYASVKPVDVYKKEALEIFETMTAAIRKDMTKKVLAAQIKTDNAA